MTEDGGSTTLGSNLGVTNNGKERKKKAVKGAEDCQKKSSEERTTGRKGTFRTQPDRRGLRTGRKGAKVKAKVAAKSRHIGEKPGEIPGTLN